MTTRHPCEKYNFIKNVKQYKKDELKNYCILYKLKVSGNKKDLVNRINNYIFNKYYCSKIQSFIRRYFIHKWMNLIFDSKYKYISKISDWKLRFNSYKENTNIKEDFETLNTLVNEPWYNIIFYNEDNIQYMFHIDTMMKYINTYKNNTNPYTRKEFDKDFIYRLNKCHFYRNKYLNYNTTKSKKINLSELTLKQRIRLLCMEFDQDGYYTNERWFKNLLPQDWYKFVYEWFELWNFRVPMTIELRRDIYPFDNSPFHKLNFLDLQHYIRHHNYKYMVSLIIETMENYIGHCRTADAKHLAITHILIALTLVSKEAREALFYLYESAI